MLCREWRLYPQELIRRSTVGPVHDSGSPVDAPAELGAFLYGSAHFAHLFGLDKPFQMHRSSCLSVCLGIIVYCNVKMVPGRDREVAGRGRRVAGGRSRAGVSDVIRTNITDHAIYHTLSEADKSATLNGGTNCENFPHKVWILQGHLTELHITLQ